MWATIMETAQIGATPKGGICRLTLTDLDRQVRDWFRAACEAAGCTVSVDDMGNIFARRPGRDPTLPPIAIGSHLDTQPTGGKFDGVIGVLSGLEVLRTLNDQGYETNAPIEVIDWTNEEGSRFAPAMLSSGRVRRRVRHRVCLCARGSRGRSNSARSWTRIGYKGEVPCGSHKLGAHFELHIEQGPILEAEAKTIGVVTGVQGMRWYEVTVTGTEGHAGATPMRLRRDALLAASRMVVAVNADRLGTTLRRRWRRWGCSKAGRTAAMSCRDRCSSPSICAIRAMPWSRRWKPRCARSLNASRRMAGLRSRSSASGIRRRCASIADCIAAVRHAAEAAGYGQPRHRLRRRA